MRIIGIDPGLQHLGWAIIELQMDEKIIAIAHGLIKTKPKLDTNQRLHELQNQLFVILNQYKPHAIGLETPFLYKGRKANINFIKAYGVIAATCKSYIHNLEINFLQKTSNNILNIEPNTEQFAEQSKKKIIQIIEITPTKVKKIVGGSGRASKVGISTMINLFISNIPENKPLTSHEFDAYAIAYCCSLQVNCLIF